MLEVNHFGEWLGLIVILGILEFIAAKIACFKSEIINYRDWKQ